jgi:branched-chain amino acid transport system substrate-binding protein
MNYPRLLLLLSFLFHAASGIADTTPIKVGAILILTGANAEYGVQAQRGAQLAVDDINQAGGVGGRPLSIIWEDETAGKADRAVAAYRKLVHVDGVKFIVGPSFQDGLLAIAPLAKTDGIALVTPSTPSLGLPQVFATWIDPSIEADHIAQHIRKTCKTVSVLAAQQSWELMVAEAFKSKFLELGGEVVSYAAPLTTTTDLRTEVLHVRRAKPDAVFISSYTLLPNYIIELRKQRVAVPLFTIEADRAALRAAGASSDGLISLGPSVPEGSFGHKYQMKYQEAPDNPSFQAYDAVQLLAKAIEAKGEKPSEVTSVPFTSEQFQLVS